VEEAQEDVQGPDHSSSHRGRPAHPPQGHCVTEYVHTEAWGWGWANECGGGVPVARSSLLNKHKGIPISNISVFAKLSSISEFLMTIWSG